MRMLGKSSLASVLNVIVNVIYILGIFWGLILLLAFVITMINPHTPFNQLFTSTTFELPQQSMAGRLQVASSVAGEKIETKPLIWVKMRTQNRLYLLLVMSGFFIWLGLVLTVLDQLRRIFRTLAAGDPFIRDNARRIKIIGWSIIVCVLLDTMVRFGSLLYCKNVISINGMHLMPPAFMIWESLPLGLLLTGIVLLVIAEIFRLGARVKEEQELTI